MAKIDPTSGNPWRDTKNRFAENPIGNLTKLTDKLKTDSTTPSATNSSRSAELSSALSDYRLGQEKNRTLAITATVQTIADIRALKQQKPQTDDIKTRIDELRSTIDPAVLSTFGNDSALWVWAKGQERLTTYTYPAVELPELQGTGAKQMRRRAARADVTITPTADGTYDLVGTNKEKLARFAGTLGLNKDDLDEPTVQKGLSPEQMYLDSLHEFTEEYQPEEEELQVTDRTLVLDTADFSLAPKTSVNSKSITATYPQDRDFETVQRRVSLLEDFANGRLKSDRKIDISSKNALSKLNERVASENNMNDSRNGKVEPFTPAELNIARSGLSSSAALDYAAWMQQQRNGQHIKDKVSLGTANELAMDYATVQKINLLEAQLQTTPALKEDIEKRIAELEGNFPMGTTKADVEAEIRAFEAPIFDTANASQIISDRAEKINADRWRRSNELYDQSRGQSIKDEIKRTGLEAKLTELKRDIVRERSAMNFHLRDGDEEQAEPYRKALAEYEEAFTRVENELLALSGPSDQGSALDRSLRALDEIDALAGDNEELQKIGRELGLENFKKYLDGEIDKDGSDISGDEEQKRSLEYYAEEFTKRHTRWSDAEDVVDEANDNGGATKAQLDELESAEKDFREIADRFNKDGYTSDQLDYSSTDTGREYTVNSSDRSTEGNSTTQTAAEAAVEDYDSFKNYAHDQAVLWRTMDAVESGEASEEDLKGFDPVDRRLLEIYEKRAKNTTPYEQLLAEEDSGALEDVYYDDFEPLPESPAGYNNPNREPQAEDRPALSDDTSPNEPTEEERNLINGQIDDLTDQEREDLYNRYKTEKDQDYEDANDSNVEAIIFNGIFDSMQDDSGQDDEEFDVAQAKRDLKDLNQQYDYYEELETAREELDQAHADGDDDAIDAAQTNYEAIDNKLDLNLGKSKEEIDKKLADLERKIALAEQKKSLNP